LWPQRKQILNESEIEISIKILIFIYISFLRLQYFLYTACKRINTDIGQNTSNNETSPAAGVKRERGGGLKGGRRKWRNERITICGRHRRIVA
jgi:hypothetical protein